MEEIDLDPFPDLLMNVANQLFLGFSIESVIGLLILVFLIILSGLVSGSETAFFLSESLVFDPAGNRPDGGGFISVMRQNVDHLVASLRYRQHGKEADSAADGGEPGSR